MTTMTTTTITKSRIYLYSAIVLIAIAALSTSARASAGPVQPAGVVNVNTATAAQLALLPGVGPKLAASIIAARPIADSAALDSVKGIGPRKLAAMSPYVVFTGATTATAKIRVAKDGAK